MTVLGAVVLAGGTSRRWDGVDKTQVMVAGRSLLDHALLALPDDTAVVVVGPERPAARPVTWAREDPPGAGPAAGLQAGLRATPADVPVLLLAADLPRAAALVATLLEAPVPEGARVLTDEGGRAHWTSALLGPHAVRTVAGLPDLADASLRRVFDALDVELVPAPAGATHDLDSPADLTALQEDPA